MSKHYSDMNDVDVLHEIHAVLLEILELLRAEKTSPDKPYMVPLNYKP